MIEVKGIQVSIVLLFQIFCGLEIYQIKKVERRHKEELLTCLCGGGTQQWSMKGGAGLSPGPEMGRGKRFVPSAPCVKSTRTWDQGLSLTTQSVQDCSCGSLSTFVCCSMAASASKLPVSPRGIPGILPRSSVQSSKEQKHLC